MSISPAPINFPSKALRAPQQWSTLNDCTLSTFPHGLQRGKPTPLNDNMHHSVTIPGAPHPCWRLGRYTQEQNGHSPLSWFFKYQHSSHFITSHSFDTTKPCHDLSLPALRPWLPGSAGPQQPHERSSSLLALPPPVASAHAHQSHGPAGSNPPFPCEEVDSAHFNIMVPILQRPQENAHCLQC